MRDPEYNKRWYESHKKEVSVQKKEYYKCNSLKIKTRVLEKKYNDLGFSLSKKKILWLLQERKCKICGCKIPLRASHLDHDHKTYKIRGILCPDCNKGLGHFKDKMDRLTKAVQYLNEC